MSKRDDTTFLHKIYLKAGCLLRKNSERFCSIYFKQPAQPSYRIQNFFYVDQGYKALPVH